MRSLFLSIFLALLIVSGCARPHLEADLPELSLHSERAWQEAHLLTTTHYRIRTDAAEETAQAIGQLMEAVFSASNKLFRRETAEVQFDVYAYARKGLYRDRLREVGLGEVNPTGIYSPVPPTGVHVALKSRGSVHPFFSLVHEGVHQYLHEVMGLPLWNRADVKFPYFPLWLNEGAAMYLEAALVDGTTLQPGRVHPARLAHLQGLKGKDRQDLYAVLTTSYDRPFSNEAYSIAWGLFYRLVQSGRWATFLATWERAVNAEFKTFSYDHASEKTDAVALQKDWAERLGRLSARVFIAQEGDMRDQAWQKEWRNWLLGLTVDLETVHP